MKPSKSSSGLEFVWASGYSMIQWASRAGEITLDRRQPTSTWTCLTTPGSLWCCRRGTQLKKKGGPPACTYQVWVWQRGRILVMWFLPVGIHHAHVETCSYPSIKILDVLLRSCTCQGNKGERSSEKDCTGFSKGREPTTYSIGNWFI